MLVCKRVIYSGRVQGVGFRASAQNLARDFAVAGHVRNLSDGTVELVVEGEPEAIDGLLSAIDEDLGRHVYDQKFDFIPSENRQGFHIRY
jgi:acylphosphatase